MGRKDLGPLALGALGTIAGMITMIIALGTDAFWWGLGAFVIGVGVLVFFFIRWIKAEAW